MNKAKLYKIIDLLDEIRAVNEMIQLHLNHNDSTMMLGQYQHRKNRLIEDLAYELDPNKSKAITLLGL
ncbi:hypothetical protein [Flavobacterium sp. CAU 1735]|uniref:hypothetical protein n=1 Tax=Flavobacterium sp. CAU 1735 TaxID=3140361 RepID=UPI003261B76E